MANEKGYTSNHSKPNKTVFLYLDDILYYISRYRFLWQKVKINGLMDIYKPYLGDEEVTRVYTRIAFEFNSLIR